jgi:hypothetical protein
MRLIGCDEYRELSLQHRYAKRRLWRYSNPALDPILSILGTSPSTEKDRVRQGGRGGIGCENRGPRGKLRSLPGSA